jgi:uncharacterized protein (DUF433 family)
MILPQLQSQLLTLSSQEKAEVIHFLLDNLTWSGIENIPGICGGSACVAGTRIPVWVLINAQDLGKTDEEILASYPRLRHSDLTNAIAYYQAHSEEIQAELRQTRKVSGQHRKISSRCFKIVLLEFDNHYAEPLRLFSRKNGRFRGKCRPKISA